VRMDRVLTSSLALAGSTLPIRGRRCRAGEAMAL